MTCGRIEENIENNRTMARALAAQGYDVALHEVPDVHNYTAWRDAFDPYLTGLLRMVSGHEARRAHVADQRLARLRSWCTVTGAARCWCSPRRPGSAWDFESNGMVESVRWLLDAGRVKLYCVDSADAATWSDRSVPLEERARRHDLYEQWVLQQAVPWVQRGLRRARPTSSPSGCSLGAYHAANIALRHADLFPSHCASPATTTRRSGTRGASVARRLLPQPDRVRRQPARRAPGLAAVERCFLVLVVGQGAWEVDPTRALPGTHRLARAAGREGHPARARRVGPRRPARLAVLASTARPPPATLLLTCRRPQAKALS